MTKKNTIQTISRNESYALTQEDIVGNSELRREVLAAFAVNPYMTRRQLNVKTQIEIASLCATLKDLEQMGVVTVAFREKCQYTGRNVSVYSPTSLAAYAIYGKDGREALKGVLPTDFSDRFKAFMRDAVEPKAIEEFLFSLNNSTVTN